MIVPQSFHAASDELPWADAWASDPRIRSAAARRLPTILHVVAAWQAQAAVSAPQTLSQPLEKPMRNTAGTDATRRPNRPACWR